MKVRRMARIVLSLVAALLLAAMPVAAGGGVIQYKGTVWYYGEGIPAYPVSELPGGKVLLHNPDGFVMWEVATEVKGGPDYFSGWYDLQLPVDSVMTAGGAIRMEGGTITSLSLDHNPTGGWDGTWQGEIKFLGLNDQGDPVYGNTASQLSAVGRGSLEGWTLQGHFGWKADWDGIKSVSVWGAMTPPKGWMEE